MARAFCTITGVQENADDTLSVYFNTNYSDASGEVVEMNGLIESVELLGATSAASLIETTVINRVIADQPSGWGIDAADILLVGVQ